MKAAEAAIQSRQWNKATQILEVMGNSPQVSKCYKKIAQHYANMSEFEVRTAVLAFLLPAKSVHLCDFFPAG